MEEADRPAQPDEDDLVLATILEGLANPTRLALLRRLRAPRTLGEIRLRPEQGGDAGDPGRAMSRQSVRGHLDRLLLAGFARVCGTRGGQHGDEYLIDHARLFAVAEEVRRLGEWRPTSGEWQADTLALDAARQGARVTGPRVVLVHGVDEGRAFRLLDRGTGLIGRRPGVEIRLDYDPFVSAEHARIRRGADGFFVDDLAASRNGTTLNWAPIPKGGSHPLTPGDVIGVGRSLLVFRE